ncbi:spore coat U domain-containing protein [Halovulum dunhuangense]|uniref:Spore coat U domain-containing protein n=1 Tax=Halovulum dunhuangense TaxID=1505036 RepID=A0A849L7C7_9RHOB|nr:spore coat U domain-containing protein [Halovulum dunhuangense]NNU82032.1 spore coat U domain-containing protein [Halovulum dunhuangense]
MLTRSSIAVLAIAIALLFHAPSARAALVCEATIQDVVFGEVSVRDGASDTTLANVSITCAGGTPSTSARVCIDIGTGSGGANAGRSPRYLAGPQGATLAYELTSGNYASSGGTLWTNAEFDVTLDANGDGSVVPGLYAEITSTGSGFVGGTYSSTFLSGSDVSLDYGAGSICTTSGDVTGFQVTADVTPSCTITAWPLDFGNIDGTIPAPIDDMTTLDISCTDGTPYTVSLGLGMGTNVTGPSQRKMMSGSEALTYGLYLDAARTMPWGDGAGDDHAGTGTGTGSNQSTPVYGRIQSGQSVPVGTYVDSVVVTIEY